MRSHSTISAVAKKARPLLFPVEKIVEDSFRMLKEARIGRFGELVDNRLAEVPNASSAIR